MTTDRGGMAELLGEDGVLAGRIPGFRPRLAQQVMAERVAATLAEGGVLAIEAGTGIGKTYAYLVPVLLSGRRVLISTGTRALQDQLYHRDLPAVAAALGRPVDVALLKGRGNYLCRYRLELAGQEPLGASEAQALQRVRAWSVLTRRGDIAEVEGLGERDAIWPRVTSTRDNCLGSRCPHYQGCHLVEARRGALAADVVVVNHHLLLADLLMREEGFVELLPGADAVVIDEAHQFAEIAGGFFGVSLGSRQLLGLAEDALAEQLAAGERLEAAAPPVDALTVAVQRLRAAFGPGSGRREWLPDGGLLRASEALGGALEGLAERLEPYADAGPGAERCLRRARELSARLAEILQDEPELALRWLDLSERGFVLHRTPVEVADSLGSLIRGQGGAWILTSATLAVGEDFGHFLGRIGLAGEAATLRLESPFDYAANALLYLPGGLPGPDRPGYTARVVETALPVLEASGGRAFLLFTSRRALAEAARVMRRRPPAYPLLVQGEAPRDRLLGRFREQGNAVLLGTASFWEGVDVKGEALSVVVIDRLPFASPQDPLLKLRLEAARRRGESPFRDHQLPQAVLGLKQGVGRLIRDVSDFGVVVICDPRLQARSYGPVFLQSLPPMPVTADLGEVQRFLRSRLAAGADHAAAGA